MTERLSGAHLLPPLTNTWYQKSRVETMPKLVVRRELRNGWGLVPVGTVVTVTYKRSGLNVEAERCDCCGVRMFVSKVHHSSLALLPEPPATKPVDLTEEKE